MLFFLISSNALGESLIYVLNNDLYMKVPFFYIKVDFYIKFSQNGCCEDSLLALSVLGEAEIFFFCQWNRLHRINNFACKNHHRHQLNLIEMKKQCTVTSSDTLKHGNS